MPNSTVLIVEDDDLIRFNIAEALFDAGFGVLEAANSIDAMALLSVHGDMRAVFTDIDMPGNLNGLQLAALVHDRWPPIHILVASSRELVSKLIFLNTDAFSQSHIARLRSLPT